MKKLLILVLMPFITWAQEVRIVSNEVMVCDLTYGEDCLLHKSRTELILPEDATMVFIKNKVTTNGFIIIGMYPKTRDNLYKYNVVGVSSGKKYLICLDLDKEYFTLSTIPFDNTLYMYYFKYL